MVTSSPSTLSLFFKKKKKAAIHDTNNDNDDNNDGLPGMIAVGIDVTNNETRSASQCSDISQSSVLSSSSSTWSQYWEYKQPRNINGCVLVPFPGYTYIDYEQSTISYEDFLKRNPPPRNPTPSKIFPNPYPQVPGYPGYGCSNSGNSSSKNNNTNEASPAYLSSENETYDENIDAIAEGSSEDEYENMTFHGYSGYGHVDIYEH